MRCVGISISKRTGVSRVVVELALLHPLEAKSVPAQRSVRHELRLEFTDCDRHLRRKDAKCDPAEINAQRATIVSRTTGSV